MVRADWTAVQKSLASVARATAEAFPEGWNVPQRTPPARACVKDVGAYNDPELAADYAGSVVIFRGAATFFDEEESPSDTLQQRYVAVWRQLGMKVISGADVATVSDAGGGLGFTYGAASATVVGSDQIRFVGGFDGDQWVMAASVRCDTPGFPRDLTP